jgi:hypothetical protein
MPLSSLTITLTDTRLIDGWVEAANRNGTTPEQLALEFLQHQGRVYADLNRIGLITSSGFIRRFSAAEYGAILAAAEQSPHVAALVDELTNSPTVALDDPRLEPGLQALAAAGLIAAERIPVILAYARPEPGGQRPTNPQRFDLFTALDGSEWIYDQPRAADGTYAQDDPATEAVESAMRWVRVTEDDEDGGGDG